MSVLLQLPLFQDVNFTKCYAFKKLATKVKNLLVDRQAKKKHLGSKFDKKPLNRNGNTGEKNRVLQVLLGKKPFNLEKKTRKKNHIE